MKQEQRDSCWLQLKADVENIMATKSLEYDGNFDVHKQFGEASRELKISMSQVAGVHLNKHIAAINNMIRGEPGTQMMHERVVDAINFLRILDEMYWEWENTKTEVNAKHGSSRAERYEHNLRLDRKG